VNRRAVWSFIQDLKKDRIVVLTTHALEEAYCLGDKVRGCYTDWCTLLPTMTRP